LLRSVSESHYQEKIKPEVTQSMIEINSSIHMTASELENEFARLHDYLLSVSREQGIKIAGGGTHPFEKWSAQKIFPATRYKNLSHIYRYLSKRSTVFGQHIHIGCPNGEEALYLTHAFTRYVPHLIALSASSPFYQGVDTGFNSSRSTVFNAFPMSGVVPMVKTWEEFSEYFFKLKHLKVISNMKDFYWDIRPKPEFGTVEIRICDTPLTIKKAVMIAAYVQAIAAYLLQEKPLVIETGLYDVYSYNRFQASRYGYEGQFIHPQSLQRDTIENDMRKTLAVIDKFADRLGTLEYMNIVNENLSSKSNDAALLRDVFHQANALTDVVKEQCNRWEMNQ
jgi:carboxylate-amine ligase